MHLNPPHYTYLHHRLYAHQYCYNTMLFLHSNNPLYMCLSWSRLQMTDTYPQTLSHNNPPLHQTLPHCLHTIHHPVTSMPSDCPNPRGSNYPLYTHSVWQMLNPLDSNSPPYIYPNKNCCLTLLLTRMCPPDSCMIYHCCSTYQQNTVTDPYIYHRYCCTLWCNNLLIQSNSCLHRRHCT